MSHDDTQRQAEGATLAAALVDPAVRLLVQSRPAEWWTTPAYHVLHRALRQLLKRGEPVDALRWTAEAETLGMADAARWIQTLPPPEDYGAVLMRAHMQRQLRALGQWCLQAHSGAPELLWTKVADAARRALASEGDLKVRSAAEVAAAAVSATRSGHPGWFASGLPALDRLLADLGPGNVLIIGARPGVGKTALALQSAGAMAAAHRSVLFATWEMAPEALALRMVAQQTPIAHGLLASGRWGAGHADAITRVTEHIAHWPLALLDAVGHALPDAEAFSLRQAAHWQQAVQVVCLDYLQLIPPVHRDPRREREVAELSRTIVQWARRQRCLCVVLAQLSRKSEERADRRPTLADLRESGAIEQDADAVLLLQQTAPDTVEMYLDKHRNGPTGRTSARWEPDTLRFLPW